MLTLSAVSVPETIYVLGDSHCETFAMRCYDVGDRRFIFRPVYIPYAQSRFFEAKPNKLSRHLLGALTRAGLAVAVSLKEIGILHTTVDPHWRHIAVVRDIPHADPAIVFSIGGIDLLQFSADELADFDDIAMDDAENVATSIPIATAIDMFSRRMKPFESALIAMKSNDFSRLSILSLVPFSSIDGQYAAGAENLHVPQRIAHLKARWRSKLIHIGNAVLAKIARDTGIPFIDRGIDWDGTGLAAPGVLIDGIHIDANARDHSAIQIMNALGQLPARIQQKKRPPIYQVRLDDGATRVGFSDFTVAEDGFAAIHDAGPDALCRLQDVNTGEVVWINRSRVICLIPIA